MTVKVVLKTQHLKKSYGVVHAVEDISLYVNQGEIVGFLGPNGSGKTTTIGMILGLIYPTAGSIEVLGKPVKPLQNRALQNVGTLMGAPSLMLSLSARDNLRLLGRLYDNVTPQRIEQVLEMVNLQQDAHRLVKQYSTGMKQRLGLALALLDNPKLLILDEPTNGMDPSGMHEIRLLLRNLVAQGISIFISSHLLHEMEMICDRAVIIFKGKIIAEGTMEELLAGKEIVRIKTSQPESVSDALQGIMHGAGKVQINGDYIDIHGFTSEQVIEYLVEKRLTPHEVGHVRHDLESVFLNLTQENSARR
ncbi:ABC transporter ATP-binding protein [Tengunoibacter tsumagoiensis]|uniref:ABC transporter ATP-binding protein n=1 Tax=Tengunoibacter tsumagoiensis TaxID=2014871 RepID=A0A402A2R9_9CHLR|nr:ATP-binding cassette domain-containing protein [Tengunoibacter tsumagoiensis]GCE13437.1 ABC transporter ATP-binding protein [Tengunoibacter tsumagoiensis]